MSKNANNDVSKDSRIVLNRTQDMPVNADEVLKNVKVPLGGDLLGRERITGAKKTRLGCDSAAERFENIVETPALWHAKQSFLGVSFLIIT